MLIVIIILFANIIIIIVMLISGTQPRNILVRGNLIHEVGIWGKQGCGIFQALSMGSTIEHNIIFNGPRAGILINDGMGVYIYTYIWGNVLTSGPTK